MAAIEKMLREAQDLLEAVEEGDSGKIEVALCRLQEAVQAAWELYQQGRINTAVRGLPRVMYQWATEELPRKVHEPSSWPEIRRELVQFINSIKLVVEPQEED